MSILRTGIKEYVDYASENMGNDVLLSQITDDTLVLCKQQILDFLGENEPEKGEYMTHEDKLAALARNNLRNQLRQEVEKL